eukprot:COSAG01_NODE_15251_length_1357_cov_2.023847_2_plen_293_part_00
MPPNWPGDCAAFGRYTPGPPNTPGTWQPSPKGYEPMDRSQSWGGFTVLYAGKDFWDARHGRRIYYANVCAPPARPQSLARVITFHPELQQLIYAPLAEQSGLRLQRTAHTQSVLLQPGEVFILAASNQSEISANFSVPARTVATGSSSSVFGVRLFMMTEGSAVNTTLEAFVDYKTGAGSLPLRDNGSVDKVTVGIRDPASGAAGTNQLSLLARDTEIEIRCFVDRTLVECFFQGGRVVLTMPLAPIADQSYCHFASPLTPPHFLGYAAFAEGAAARLLAAEVYDVGSIWEP